VKQGLLVHVIGTFGGRRRLRGFLLTRVYLLKLQYQCWRCKCARPISSMSQEVEEEFAGNFWMCLLCQVLLAGTTRCILYFYQESKLYFVGDTYCICMCMYALAVHVN